MTKSMRAQIIDAVYAAMQTTGIVDTANVVLYRANEPIDYPAMTIDDKGSTFIEEDVVSIRRTVELMIVFDIQGDGSVDVMDKANALLLAIEIIIGSNSQWGGLAEMSTFGDYAVEPTFESAVPTMRGGLSISVQYTQNRYDPTRP